MILAGIGFGIIWVLVGGCAQFVEREYRALEWPLGEHHQLELTTYPAGFPSSKDEFEIPVVYVRYYSNENVFFQVHVKHARQQGPPFTRDIASCVIMRLAYQFPGEAWTSVITEEAPVNGNFWQQREDSLPFRKGETLKVRVRLEFNGQPYAFERTMKGVLDPSILVPRALRNYAI